MNALFLNLLNRGIAAGYLILAVIALRFLFKKAPRWISCALWAMVALRLLCPVSPESSFSLIPSGEAISPLILENKISSAHDPAVSNDASSTPHPSAPSLNNTIDPVLREALDAGSPDRTSVPQALIPLFALLWGAGLAFLLGFALLNFVRIRHTVQEAAPLNGNIYICDAVQSPFILGIVRPRIYLSSSIRKEEIRYVLAHERTHLKRKDHWWKLLGYFLLAVYWIHPLCWAAYLLFCRDIELSCDERVVRDMSLEEKKAYSRALASLSLPRRLVLACPPAFGEIGVKERIQAILNYKKPALWVIPGACAISLATALCFLTNPRTDSSSITSTLSKAGEWNSFPAPSHVGVPLYEETSETPEPDLDTAITKAIFRHNLGLCSWLPVFSCCDFASLGTETLPPEEPGLPSTVVCYGWALYQDYAISSDGIELKYGSYLPLALTFSLDEDGYLLKELWRPREGGYLASDVRAKFPADLAEDGINSQKYGLAQTQRCYDQAVQYSGLDTEAVIGRLLKEVCSEPSPSSNPRDYLTAHAKEYHELLYYGEYTLRYCFARFQKGGETGLEGKIMALVCEELLQNKNGSPTDAATAATGQEWYDALTAAGS